MDNTQTQTVEIPVTQAENWEKGLIRRNNQGEYVAVITNPDYVAPERTDFQGSVEEW